MPLGEKLSVGGLAPGLLENRGWLCNQGWARGDELALSGFQFPVHILGMANVCLGKWAAIFLQTTIVNRITLSTCSLPMTSISLAP